MNRFSDFMQCPLCGNFFPDVLELGSPADVSCPEKKRQQVWARHQQHVTDSIIPLMQGLHHRSIMLKERDTATCSRFND
jgi:hypothetical protein